MQKILHIKDIEKLASQGESDVLEFKKSTGDLEGAAHTLCAFLNQKGGTVLLGVLNSGKLVGQDVTDATRREIARTLQKFEPPANIEVSFVSLPSGKQIIVLQVGTNPRFGPYIYSGRPYQRLQSSTSLMPQTRYEQLLIERMQKTVDWESLPAKTNDINLLDGETIRRTISLGIKESRIPPQAAQESIEEMLVGLKAMENGQLLNAAMVLFAKDCFPDYSQCHLKMARFRGTDKLGAFIDNRQIYGHAFKLFDEAMMFVQRHLPLSSHFEEGDFERKDRYSIPLPAIREALVNAICHRDYSVRSGHIALAIYDTHMEIWNYGTLYGDLTLEDLKRKHPSQLRNETIAGVFYRRGLIEKWGTGTLKIISQCKAEGLPEPEYESYGGGVSIIFRFREPISPAIKESRNLNALTKRQKEIVAVLEKTPALSANGIMKEIKEAPTERTIRRDLLVLQKLGFVGLHGTGRGAVWRLAQK